MLLCTLIANRKFKITPVGRIQCLPDGAAVVGGRPADTASLQSGRRCWPWASVPALRPLPTHHPATP